MAWRTSRDEDGLLGKEPVGGLRRVSFDHSAFISTIDRDDAEVEEHLNLTLEPVEDEPEPDTQSELTAELATIASESAAHGEYEGEQIYIGVSDEEDEDDDEDDIDVELTDDEVTLDNERGNEDNEHIQPPQQQPSSPPPQEEEPPQTGLPLPSEHIYVQDPRRPLLLSDFHVIKTLGTGTFGRVLLVCLHEDSPHHRPDTVQHFAMKILRKNDVVRLKQVKHVNAERSILARIQHPFIVDLYATFQDHLNVYMLLSYVPGGELFSHLRRAGRFTPDVTRFYLGGIVLALRYLHRYNIIYRDLKPENLLLDHRGYLRITDFGFAKVVDDRTWTLCGTPEYLAPEIIEQKGHSKAVDWWACGILTYEMLVGYPPFFDEHPFGIYQKIVQGHVYWPQELDTESKEFIRAFLNPDRSKRLGNLAGGAEDVLNHPWFAGVDWVALENGEIPAPLIPHVVSASDTRNFTPLPYPNPAELPGLFPSVELPPDTPDDSNGWQFLDF